MNIKEFFDKNRQSIVMATSGAAIAALIFGGGAAIANSYSSGNGLFAEQTQLSQDEAQQIALSNISGEVVSTDTQSDNETLIYGFKIKAADGTESMIYIDGNTGNVVSKRVTSMPSPETGQIPGDTSQGSEAPNATGSDDDDDAGNTPAPAPAAPAPAYDDYDDDDYYDDYDDDDYDDDDYDDYDDDDDDDYDDDDDDDD